VAAISPTEIPKKANLIKIRARLDRSNTTKIKKQDAESANIAEAKFVFPKKEKT
jgi:hypothetical protein